jgi:hypothetical protein
MPTVSPTAVGSCLSGGVQETWRTSTCSVLSETLAEPLPGTAAVAGSWLCLEQRGPWGPKALLHSHLDTALGRELSARAAASGVRVQLIRRPGRHTDAPPASPRRVYLASTDPGGSWLREAVLSDPADLLDVDFDRIAHGRHDGWGQPSDDPLLLICTHGRRDRCCAISGRALVTELAERHGDLVWETSHTGGHRFAPAAVALPSGYTYGRLTPEDGDAILSAASAGKVSLQRCRGRSTWSRTGQSAELAVREHIGENQLDALRVDGVDAGEVIVTHQDGRRWIVVVRERELEPPRPNSCGKDPAPAIGFVAETVTPLSTDQ